MRFCEVSAAAITPPRSFAPSGQGPHAVAVAVNAGTAAENACGLVPSIASVAAGTDTAQRRTAAGGRSLRRTDTRVGLRKMTLQDETNDLAALKLAMAHANKEPARAAQLRSKLRDEPWTEVAGFAAYGCQSRSLHLLPWESRRAMATPNIIPTRQRGSCWIKCWPLASRAIIPTRWRRSKRRSGRVPRDLLAVTACTVRLLVRARVRARV